MTTARKRYVGNILLAHLSTEHVDIFIVSTLIGLSHKGTDRQDDDQRRQPEAHWQWTLFVFDNKITEDNIASLGKRERDKKTQSTICQAVFGVKLWLIQKVERVDNFDMTQTDQRTARL